MFGQEAIILVLEKSRILFFFSSPSTLSLWLAIWILLCHFTQIVHYILIKIIKIYMQELLGLPLFLFCTFQNLTIIFFTSASKCLHWTCLNHLKWCSRISSSIDITSNYPPIQLLWTISIKVSTDIHFNICLSVTPNLLIWLLLIVQHFAP